jgi:hypothetical protein
MPHTIEQTIEITLRNAVQDGLIPGLVAAVGDSQETTCLGAFGQTGADSTTSMPEDAIFRIASD